METDLISALRVRRNTAQALRRQALDLAERAGRHLEQLRPRRSTSVDWGQTYDGLETMLESLRELRARAEAQLAEAEQGRSPNPTELEYVGARLNAAALALTGIEHTLADGGIAA